MIRLTQHDNAGVFLVDPSRIFAVTDCPPYSDQLIGCESGRRTRIDYQGGMVLVTETPDEIAALAGWTQAPSPTPQAQSPGAAA